MQVNKETQTAENLYYRNIDPADVEPARRDQTHGRTKERKPNLGLPSPDDTLNTDTVSSNMPAQSHGQPPYLFATASELLRICQQQDLTIGQVVWENELAFRSPSAIRSGLLNRGCLKTTTVSSTIHS